MIFKNEKTQNWYIKDTPIENIFISEHMCVAPGDFVKVYILAQMYANMGETADPRIFARQLVLTEADVDEAWDYWVNAGLARKIKKGLYPEDGYDIELISSKEVLYCGPSKAQKEETEVGVANIDHEDLEDFEKTSASELVDDELSELFSEIERILGRPIASNEAIAISEWPLEYGVNMEVILYAYSYCVRTLGKDHIRYIDAVIKEWAKLGLSDSLKIEEYLETCEQSRTLQRRIFKALGFRRNATEAEEKIINKWLTTDGFSLEEILEACGKTSGISNPNINYVDKVLQSKRQTGQAGKLPEEVSQPVSMAMVSKYYDYLRDKNREEIRGRINAVCKASPELNQVREKLRELAPQITQQIIRGNLSEVKALKEEQLKLQKEQTQILSNLGHPGDYLEEKYLCTLCKDTGMRENGEKCSCFEKRLSEAKEWQISLRKQTI